MIVLCEQACFFSGLEIMQEFYTLADMAYIQDWLQVRYNYVTYKTGHEYVCICYNCITYKIGYRYIYVIIILLTILVKVIIILY